MRSVLRSASVSWKTTAVGILLFLETLVAALIAVTDGDASTLPNWNLVVAAATAMFGLLLAKDGNKSTEDHQ